MKKVSVIANLSIVICIILMMFSCERKSKNVSIGFDIPLTGMYDYWGNEFKNGADIYLSFHPELNVEFEDNQGDTKTGVSIANKLLNIDNVDAVVSLFAPFSFPLRDIAEKAEKPLISSFNSSTTFTTGYNYCFSDFASHDMQLPLLVGYVTDSMQLRRGVYYCVNDDYGTDGAKIVTNLFDEKNIDISGELFNTGETNHRNVIAKLLNDSVDFVFLIARDRDLINAVNQIRERNKDILILGVGSFDAPVIWEGIPADNQRNVLFASSYFEKDYDEESRLFYDEFYKINKREPNYPAVFGYTICQYLSESISKAHDNGDKLIDVMSKLDYNSIRGVIKMTDNHVIYSSIAIYKRENGNSVPVALELDYEN